MRKKITFSVGIAAALFMLGWCVASSETFAQPGKPGGSGPATLDDNPAQEFLGVIPSKEKVDARGAIGRTLSHPATHRSASTAKNLPEAAVAADVVSPKSWSEWLHGRWWLLGIPVVFALVLLRVVFWAADRQRTRRLTSPRPPLVIFDPQGWQPSAEPRERERPRRAA